MYFTLVSTVFNEAKRLDQTIEDITNQTLQPSEIIITDAGSTDGTFEMLKKWQEVSAVPIVLFQKLRCNVAEGRNIAIRAAKYHIIASMDFGCRYHVNWLESLILPFNDTSVKVVGGAYSVIEEEIRTKAAKAAYILNNGYNRGFSPDTFIPSSRSIAYKKEVYDHIGGYCEWLTLAADDMVFGMLIRKLGYPIFIENKPYASWIRHETANGYIKEAYRYGLGNGEANIQHNDFIKMVIRKLSWILFFACILIILTGIFFWKKVLIIPAVLAILLSFLFKMYLNYFRNWLRLKSQKYTIFSLLHAFELAGRISTGYIRGYIKGYYFASIEQKIEAIKLQKRLS